MKISAASTLLVILTSVNSEITNQNYNGIGGVGNGNGIGGIGNGIGGIGNGIGGIGNGIGGIGNGIGGIGNGIGGVGNGINPRWFPGNQGYYNGGLVGSILGSVFGGGYGGIGMGYGNGSGGLVGGILGSVFGNGCNGGIVGSVFGGNQGNCANNYYSLYQTGRSGSSKMNYKVANGVASVEITGMPKNAKSPQGILRIESNDKAMVKNGQQIRLDPNGQFKMSYL